MLKVVLPLLVTVALVTATPTGEKSLFGCNLHHEVPINLRDQFDLKLAVTECKINVDDCMANLQVCARDHLTTVHGDNMDEATYQNLLQHIKDCNDDLMEKVTLGKVYQGSVADMQKKCPSLGELTGMGFNFFNFIKIYRCAARRINPAQMKAFGECISTP